jgi:RAB protein geranylgeranyltransferase component A
MVRIPFSKSEIFLSNKLSLKEKRQLFKVIEMCLDANDRHIDAMETAKDEI